MNHCSSKCNAICVHKNGVVIPKLQTDNDANYMQLAKRNSLSLTYKSFIVKLQAFNGIKIESGLLFPKKRYTWNNIVGTPTPPPFLQVGGGWASNQIFKKGGGGGLDSIPTFRGGDF